MLVSQEAELVGLAAALGAAAVPTVSPAERRLLDAAIVPAIEPSLRSALESGEDPLGAAFCRLRSPGVRRAHGATYTPPSIVRSMLAWAARSCQPTLVVDPGTGSGRFLVEAGRRFPRATLFGAEVDPVAALMARARLAASGFADRTEIVLADYREAQLPARRGVTLFVGNPPYVRHHDIAPRWKAWLSETARRRGLRASQLAGLHVHFLLATLEHARPGDVGCFITAAEWLDVNYGALPRDLFLGPLGGRALHVVEPTAHPFPDAETTAVIIGFCVGGRPRTVEVRRIRDLSELGDLRGDRTVRASTLADHRRWTPLTRPARAGRTGMVELGELCRVRRGQVTGANRIWIAGPSTPPLPHGVLFPAVTRAKELFRAGPRLQSGAALRLVIDLPEDLDALPPDDRRLVERFLDEARRRGADLGYVASHRRRWWSVGLHEPAPILATYMARRPPAFVRNVAAARHINIAHGLYPRIPLTAGQLDALARYLSGSVDVSEGRTYAGGLTKFEPREMERLLVPTPEGLRRRPSRAPGRSRAPRSGSSPDRDLRS